VTTAISEPPLEVEDLPAAGLEAEPDQPAKTRELVIVNWSGDLDKVWPVLILSSAAAASGVRTQVFVTFWGLLPFVKDQKRIIGDHWMQKMLTLMQRPGIEPPQAQQDELPGNGALDDGRPPQEIQRRQPA